MDKKDEKYLRPIRNKIRSMLKRRNMKQRVAAELSGVDEVSLSRILSGKKSPRYTEVLRLLELDAE